jgi:transposase
MGIGLKKLVAKKYNTVLIDEYNTSKLCCNCHKENDNKVINSESLFRLLTCKHCNVGSSENLNNPTLKCSKFLNRDMNSCVNMQCIVKSYLKENRRRPKEFTRI